MPRILQFPPQQDRDQLISDHLNLVKPIAERIYKKLFPPIQLDDLQGVGLLALVRACDAPAVSPDLIELYIRAAIRNAILDDVRRSISRHERLYGLLFEGRGRGERSRGEPRNRPFAQVEAGGGPVTVLTSHGPRVSLDLRRGIAQLPARERHLLELRLEGRTQAQAGRSMGLTQRAAAKVEARAIGALRRRLAPPKSSVVSRQFSVSERKKAA